VDARNTARMHEIVEEYGWPTKSMVGGDGTRSAWLLVQHADMDVAFQRKCLALMRPRLADGQVSPADVAYLTDRVRVNEGEPQVYGTQFHLKDGQRQPRPIEEPEKVDERRASMGMKPLADYAAFMNT